MKETEKATKNIDNNHYALDWEPKFIKPLEEAIKQHKQDCEDFLGYLQGISEGRTSIDDQNLEDIRNDLKQAIKVYEKEGF